jgi:aminoethylphosphonate catabolism LysR family transcriptional regulator
MNITQLRAFDAISQAGSVTGAARRLRLTQPAVSLQLGALESEYGVELFHRSGRRLVPTDAGIRLFALTRRLFDLEREADQLLLAVRGLESGRVTVAADAPYHVIAVIAELRSRHPSLEVAVLFGNSQRVQDSLLSYESDAAILGFEPRDPRLSRTPYLRHRIVVLVPSRHPWATRDEVPLAELHDQPMVRREQGSATQARFDEVAGQAGVRPRHVLEIGSREAMREAVAAGLGIGIISEAELGRDDRLRGVPFSDVEVYADEYLVCLSDRTQARVVRAVLDAAEAARAAASPIPLGPPRRRHD